MLSLNEPFDSDFSPLLQNAFESQNVCDQECALRCLFGSAQDAAYIMGDVGGDGLGSYWN